MTVDTEDAMRSHDLCAQLGVTYRRLNRWCRYGVLQPQQPQALRSGSGYPVTFGPAEVRVVHFVAALADLGAKMTVLGHAARQVRDHPEWSGDVLVSRTGRVAPRVEGATFGRACWVVTLDGIEAEVPPAA